MKLKHSLFTTLLALALPFAGFAQDEKAEPAASGDGIAFFKGTFEQALAKAKAENKPLFVDFYAVWCVPCKRIAKEIFPLKTVGDYFNKNFVSIQLDAEAKENVEVAKTYNVAVFPTLAFIGNDGKALSIIQGAVDEKALIEEARIVTGESKGFEQLYKEYRADPSNLSLQQDLLTQAGTFLSAQDGMDAEKWVVRIRKLYREYITRKLGPDLINKQDYIIITSLGGDDKDLLKKVVDSVNANLPAWLEKLGDAPAYYVIEYNDGVMEALAKKGDPAYREGLERIKGEYAGAYAVIPKSEVSPYDRSKTYYDALFALASEKDADRFISLMSDYFKMLGSEVRPSDYAKAAQYLYQALGDKIQPRQHETAISWLNEALKGNNPIVDRLNYLVMIGDSYKALKDYDKAQAQYNQAFAESFQLKDMGTVQEMVQATIIRKASELDLLRE